MHGRSQSAIEFLNTYSFVFLIIAVVLAMLYILVQVPSTVLPSQCTFYSGFSCQDSEYSVNAVSGTTSLYLLALDSQPGVVNITSFSADIASTGSVSGSCAPSRVSQGQLLLCTATFASAATAGASYVGSFAIVGNYCTPGASNSISVNCPATSQFSYTGFINTQAAVGQPLFVSTSVQTTTSITTVPTVSTSVTTSVSTSTTTITAFAFTVSNQANTVLDSGQTLTVSGSASGGNTPYTISVAVSNAVSPSIILATNVVTTGGSAWSATFATNSLFVTNSPIVANAVAADAEPKTLNGIYTSNIVVNLALSANQLAPSSPSINSGQGLTLTASWSGGTPPYTVDWYSGTSNSVCLSYGTLLAADSGLQSASNAITVTPSNSVYYCATVTDSPSTPVTFDSQADHVTVSSILSSCPNNYAGGLACFGSILYSSNTALSGNLNVSGSVTVNTGVTLTSGGFIIYAGGTLTNNGVIKGGAAPGYSYASSYAGSGGGGACAGSSGGSTQAAGGNGGGYCSGGSGGSTPSAPTMSNANIQTWFASTFVNYISGATGGNGGSGGNGGAGSYGVYIQANKITAGTISVGGNAGSAGSGSSGGGGGGGGIIMLVYGSGGLTAGTYTVTGGAGGSSGSPGGAGRTVTYQYTTQPLSTVHNLNLPRSIDYPSTYTVMVTCTSSQDSCAADSPLGTHLASGTGTASYTTPVLAAGNYVYYANDITSGFTQNGILTVNPALSANSPTPSNTAINFGNSITLTAHPTGGTLPYAYQWFSGASPTCTSDASIGGATSNTYTASPTSNTYYCYSVTDSALQPSSSYSTAAYVSVNFLACTNNYVGGSPCRGNILYSASTTLAGNLDVSSGITVNTGVTLTTNGFIIYAGGAFTNNGVVTGGLLNNYGAASYYGENGNDGTGQASSYAGSGGGGGGGDAGQGVDACGGSGGSTLAYGGGYGCNGENAQDGSTPSAPSMSNANIQAWYSNGFANYLSGAGGGGAGDSCNTGNAGSEGDGGDGSYGVYIQAQKIVAGTMTFSGNGGGSGDSGCGSGGGGGGGGAVMLAYGSGGYTAGSYNVGGGGAGSGYFFGGNGASGQVTPWQYATQPLSTP